MFTIEEVHARTGITIRNIKFWTRLYGLETQRKGRRNLYPDRTVRILEAVAALADLGLFSSHFMKWLVAAAQGKDVEAGGADERYRRYAALHPTLSILPGLPPPPRTAYVPRDDW